MEAAAQRFRARASSEHTGEVYLLDQGITGPRQAGSDDYDVAVQGHPLARRSVTRSFKNRPGEITGRGAT